MDKTSLPMRGEWIEIMGFYATDWWPRLSPCGESGLKSCPDQDQCARLRLSPCGESGLKSSVHSAVICDHSSLPMRGEWIEILIFRRPGGNGGVSPHAGRVD